MRRQRLRILFMLVVLSLFLMACGGTDAPQAPHVPQVSHAEQYAPGVQGEVRTVQVGDHEITYEVIDGLAIFQGDMILGKADEVEALLAQDRLLPTSAICQFDFGFGCGRWENGVIGYAFANDWGSAANNTVMRERIQAAMSHWQEHTGLTFVQRSGGQRVVFRNSGGCSSEVGRREITGLDPQFINVGLQCSLGTVIHEIGHAVGMWHEQSRADRDNFVRVDFGAVQDGQLHQFFGHAGLGADVGPYDFGSIMHYHCRAFAKDERNTVVPTVPGVTCADIGQRSGLSEGDILGAYTLYPPRFSLAGATSGETKDRFDLSLNFETKPVRADYIEWRSNRVEGVLATGPSLTLLAADVPNGSHTITVSIVIFNTLLTQRTLELTLANTPPSVNLGSDRTVDLNRSFFLSPTVTDTEDGTCLPPVCTYSWNPAPNSGSGATAGYLFTTEGRRTITVTVRDKGGATGTASVSVNVVNSPPEPRINVPTRGAAFPVGATIEMNGSATDINEGAGPGPGTLTCSRLTWTSSVLEDTITGTPGCSPSITFGGTAGARTLTLTARDTQGSSAQAQVTVTATVCEENCRPTGSLVLTSTPDFDPSSYVPTYFTRTNLEMEISINDADTPPDNPVAYAVTATQACLALDPSHCPATPTFALASGSVTVPAGPASATQTINWRPQDNLAPWPNCSTPENYRLYLIKLQVQDARGGTSTFEAPIRLGCSLD